MKKPNIQLSMPGAVLIAGVLIAGAVLFKSSPVPPQALAANDPSQAAEADPPTNPEKVNPVDPARDHIYGNPDAPVKIVEYSDMDCPFCERFQSTLKTTVDKSNGKVAWVYRHFPLSFHIHSDMESAASECVNKLAGNDAFWKFVTAALEINSSANKVYDPKPIIALADSLGVDHDAFVKCSTSGEFDHRISVDASNGNDTGGNGTPWSIVIEPDGTYATINGAQSQSVVDDTITKALAKAK